MRRLFCLPFLMCLASTRIVAQAAPVPPEEYEKRIRALEDRLATVEAQLAVLVSERGHSVPEAEPAQVSQSEPIAPPAALAPAPQRHPFEMPPELVPEIGKIGAEVGVLASDSGSPFKLNSGQFYGGFIDLPLIDRPNWLHGRISYEIVVGLSRSKSQVQTTSNVAQVANLAVLNTLFPNGGLTNVNNALTGTGTAPFPVTTSSQLNMRLLQVVPFALKYSTTALDRWRLRPYLVAGFGTYVTIHDEVPASAGVRLNADLPPAIISALNAAFGGQAPFGTALVAGQIGQSPELVARGLPGGNGNLDIGLQTGGGFEFRLTRTLSIGFDGRFNKISGSDASFATYGTRIGLHF